MLSGAVVWSFAPLLQLAGASAAILLLAPRRRPLSQALDLYFLGSGPWSAWLLAVAGVLALVPPPLLLTLLVGWGAIVSFFGDGGLAPWDLALEARRRGLHAFAITNHDQVLAAK